MSHYSVLVVGEDIDEALAPFDENIETPPRFEGEVEEEELFRFASYYLIEHPEGEEKTEAEVEAIVTGNGKAFKELYEEHGDDWNGETWKKNSKGVWCEYTTYNPNSKWDWYQVGGRYAGKLLLKESVPQTSNHAAPNPSLLFSDEDKAKIISDDKRVDSALVGEVDFERMNAQRLKRNTEAYDEFESKLKGEGFKFGAYFDYGVENVEVSTEEFEANKDNPMYVWNKNVNKPFRYQTKEEYVGTGKFATFAMLIDGEWYERGSMGWWGIVTDSKENLEWETEFQKKLESLHPDTRITVVDCHI